MNYESGVPSSEFRAQLEIYFKMMVMAKTTGRLMILGVACFLLSGGRSRAADPKIVYENNFEKAEVGKVPEDFLVAISGLLPNGYWFVSWFGMLQSSDAAPPSSFAVSRPLPENRGFGRHWQPWHAPHPVGCRRQAMLSCDRACVLRAARSPCRDLWPWEGFAPPPLLCDAARFLKEP